MLEADEYCLKQLEAADRVTGLSLGDAAFLPLKTFFQRHAKAFEAASLARTYIVQHRRKSVAYITIVCGEIAVEDDASRPIDDTDVEYRYDQYPAIKIARLAVDKDHRGRNLGRSLVDFVLGLVLDEVCPTVGCRFVVVDAKPQSVAFYARMGFTLLDTTTNRRRTEPVMFVDLKKLAAKAS